MIVYRDGRQDVSGPALLAELVYRVREVTRKSSSDPDLLLDALLRSGELECALADAGFEAAGTLTHITDTLARALLARSTPDINVAALERIVPPATLSISPAEGFAYYALHPLQYADLLERTVAAEREVAVIGIRSIGTTLSAVVCAAANTLGRNAARITVRPGGHPFHRQLSFAAGERQWIAERRDALFCVVDEGPGLSGSSFLAVADAFVGIGIARKQIVLLCSHEPDVASLIAQQAATRWAALRHVWVSGPLPLPADAGRDLSAGKWRELLGGDRGLWPSSWIQNERLKFLSADGKSMLKFAGYGRFGEAVLRRAEAVARGGFGPSVERAEHGFHRYEFVRGERPKLTDDFVRHLARYCAFRAEVLGTSYANTPELNRMMRYNIATELQVELASDMQLDIARPVIADGRMLPQEWLCSPDGHAWKIDSDTHGDDHFFPGPCDIAWDLAGAIVEWGLDDGASDVLLREYERRSGDDAGRRLEPWLLAYVAFRTAYTRMAADAMRGTDEEPRLSRDYRRYRQKLERVLSAQPHAAVITS
jgi:hypothetical protein